MLQLKQTVLSVSLKKNDKTIWADKNGKQYLYLNCYQYFNSNHKRFKNAFEGIKLFGELDKLTEMLKRLEKNEIVKIGIYYCELYLMQYQDKNVKPFASSDDWNFDKNKFKTAKKPAIEESNDKPYQTDQNRPKPYQTDLIVETEQVEEIKLLGDGIELP
ncbi:MAG: hypothetical protein RR348_04325 [Clostridia bacterium]